MELNDIVSVKLTEVGAKIVNNINAEMQELYPGGNWKADYKEGDTYRTILWSLINTFGESCWGGVKIVFTDLELWNSKNLEFKNNNF